MRQAGHYYTFHILRISRQNVSLPKFYGQIDRLYVYVRKEEI
jgi:hypothetical protein